MASDQLSALLLLPPPPSASFNEFKAAYEPALLGVCTKLVRELNGANHTAILDIALSLPGLLSPSCRPRTRAFSSLQSLLESIYRLIGIVCVEQGIELDGPGGIDPRVILLDYDSVQTAVTRDNPCDGPIIDLQTLARSGRLWDYIYYPDNQVGQGLATAFSSFYSESRDPNGGSMSAIPDAPNWKAAESLLVMDDNHTSTTHYSVAVGGTFDHFHIGHKLLLTATALVLQPAEDVEAGNVRKITVGVTGEGLLAKKKYAEYLESWDERCMSTGSFLSAIMDFRLPETSAPRIERESGSGPDDKYIQMQMRPDLVFKLVQITDPFGLHTGEVPTDDAESFASKISSTDIRRRRMEMATE